MASSRLSLLEESTFNDSESSAIQLGYDRFYSLSLSVLRRILPLFAMTIQGRQLSAMNIQNIYRERKSKFISLVGLMLIFVWEVRDKCSFLPISVVFDSNVQKVSKAVSFVALLAFLGGFVRENRPEMILARTNPVCGSPAVQRVNSVEFLVRLLIADSLSNFATTLVPIFSVNRVLHALKAKLLPTRRTRDSECAACGRLPVSACIAEPCGHCFCFYCANSETVPLNCGLCAIPVVSFKSAPVSF